MNLCDLLKSKSRKIVINIGFGSFSLSDKGTEALMEKKGISLNGDEFQKYLLDLKRDDKDLVEVIEKLGPKASDSFCLLQIVYVNPNKKFRIIEHENMESIEYYEDIEWYEPLTNLFDN